MKNLIKLFVILVIATSCKLQPIQFVQSNGVEKYKMENGKVDFTAKAVISNPNWFGIKLKNTDLAVYADSTFIGYLHLKEKVKIKRKSETEVTVPLELMLEQGVFFKLLALSKKENVAVRFKGEAKGGVFIFSKKMDIDQTKDISLKGLKLNF